MPSSALVFSIDDAYVLPFKVFFHSLVVTDSIPLDTSIYILHSESLCIDSISDVTHFIARYGRKVFFLNPGYLLPSQLPIRPGDHVSPATFYRLFISEILPSSIDLAIYLDVDMLVLRSIESLWSTSISSCLAAADHCSPLNGIRLWGDCSGSYFQGGVLVIPVQLWRDQKIVDQFLEVMAKQQDRILWWDQDVLNLVFCDRWQRLPVWFNVCQAVMNLIPQDQIEQEARIIHFSGRHKPWNSLDSSPFASHWDALFKDAFDFEFDRSAFQPSRRSLLKHAVLSRMSGLIHGRQG